MKKILFILTFILLVTGCNSSNIKTISYNELNQKFENKESFILFFEGNDSETLKSTLNKILEKNNLEAYTIKTNKLDNDKLNELRLKVDFEEPSITFVIGGNDPSVITHITNVYIEEDDLETRLRDMNFIK